VKGNGKGLNKGMIYGKEGEKNESSLIWIPQMFLHSTHYIKTIKRSLEGEHFK
jgi:hypothetical protein